MSLTWELLEAGSTIDTGEERVQSAAHETTSTKDKKPERGLSSCVGLLGLNFIYNERQNPDNATALISAKLHILHQQQSPHGYLAKYASFHFIS
jgi:hypothetical protein